MLLQPNNDIYIWCMSVLRRAAKNIELTGSFFLEIKDNGISEFHIIGQNQLSTRGPWCIQQHQMIHNMKQDDRFNLNYQGIFRLMT